MKTAFVHHVFMAISQIVHIFASGSISKHVQIRITLLKEETMKTRQWMMWGVLAVVLNACTENKQHLMAKAWEKLPVVAKTVDVDGEPMMVCDYSALEDSLRLPLSFFAEDLQVVKLDDRDEALVGMGQVYVSDNYILVNRHQNVPCKLFRKDGTFVSNVGGIGQGPGEYRMVYDVQIDEPNGRIYVLPWITKELFVYDLNGKFIQGIPLNKGDEDLLVGKGTFRVDAKNNRIGVCLLPFDYLKKVAWVQDMEGNVIGEIPMNHLKVKPDYSNEVFMNKTDGALDFSVFTYFELRPDTLYHYNMEANKLQPRFTLDFGSRDIQMHSYAELPLHYLGDVSKSEQVSGNMFQGRTAGAYVVSKQDGKGGFFHIYNDFLGNLPMDRTFFWNCRNGYYTQNIEPAVLMEKLEEALEDHPDMDEAMRTKLQTLLDSIDEDHNNYILYAKLKN